MTGLRQEQNRLRHGSIRILSVVLLLVGIVPAMAQDPPHWSGARFNYDCTSNCHVVHHSANLTQEASNVNLCQACHVGAGDAADLPVDTVDMAVPGFDGFHHAFDVCAVNPDLDTQVPGDAERNLRLMGADGACPDGYVVCSTCHNQHKAEQPYGGESRVGAVKEVFKDAATTGAVSSAGTFTGAEGVWYLVQIVQSGDETSALFRYSKDNRLSWIPAPGADPPCDPVGPPPDLSGCKTAAGSNPIPLNDLVDEGVQITFSVGSYTAGDEWEFNSAWPYLRRSLPLNLTPDALLDSGANTSGDDFCRDCHRSWVMDHTAVGTWDDSYKSHPVGIALDANGGGYDRTVPLDGNGADQGSGGADGNATNDLRFDNASLVQCLTCHGVHYADSNTETIDTP